MAIKVKDKLTVEFPVSGYEYLSHVSLMSPKALLESASGKPIGLATAGPWKRQVPQPDPDKRIVLIPHTTHPKKPKFSRRRTCSTSQMDTRLPNSSETLRTLISFRP